MSVQDDWKIPRRSRECAVSGRPFMAGDRVVSELIDRGDEFERVDRLDGAEVPAHAPEAFSRWTSVWPPEPERAPGVDLDLARRFLRDLLAEGSTERRPLAYVLSLLLIRKRRLKVVDRGLAPDGMALLRVSPAGDPDAVLEVPTPPMTREIVDAVSAQVAELFGFGPVLEEEPEPEGDEPEPADSGETA